MEPARLFQIDDLYEQLAAADERAAEKVSAPMQVPRQVPSAANLSRQILRLAAMATVEHQRVAQETSVRTAKSAA
jgi:hypothetical protein